MVIKTAAPGITVNEIDLTRGTSDAITTNVGGLCGAFQKGPVDELIKVETEAEFERTFGKPTDENYEYWWTVSNFLNYSGVCYVVRCDDSIGDEGGSNLQKMRCSADILDNNEQGPYIKNEDHFLEDVFNGNGNAVTDARFVSRTPGTWGNGIAIATIDAGADYQTYLESGAKSNTDGSDVNIDVVFDNELPGGQNIGTYTKVAAVNPNGIKVGSFVFAAGSGTVSNPSKKAFIRNYEDGVFSLIEFGDDQFQVGDVMRTTTDDNTIIQSGVILDAYTQGVQKFYDSYGASTSLFTDGVDGTLMNDSTDAPNQYLLLEYAVDSDQQNRQIVNSIFERQTYTVTEGTKFGWTLNPRANQRATKGGPVDLGETYMFNFNRKLWVNLYETTTGDMLTDGVNTFTIRAAGDWYNQQIAFQGIPWYRFASRPGTSPNATDRGATNDEMNILVFDSTGYFTGTKGNLLESYVGVSKLNGAITTEGERNYYMDQINRRSLYIYANAPVSGLTNELNDDRDDVGIPIGDGVDCAYIYPGTRVLTGGVDQLSASLGELQEAYSKFDRENVSDLDYILQGPSENNLDDAVAKANFLISIVEERRDCMAFLSPPRYAVINQGDKERVTDLIIQWANELSSSSYTVIDSGYKYMYDRFNDEYRHVPLNGDVAGTLTYSSFRSEPWYSPAGFARGLIRNVVKLSYNPSKTQRDSLYTARVNPVVTFPGEGTVLFGDKTALGYSSAFDRINVRRLFLVVEKEIAKMSRTTLFEFNDDVTRTLFKNNVNPFLREVQAKRGMYDFLVVCDETNNSPEIIDRNEFVADIYIKPAKSINFISLNFVATKTGVVFDEAVALFRRNKT